MSELDDGKISKDLWDFSVERGHIDIEKHPIGVLGAGLRSYVAALEAKLEKTEKLLEECRKAISSIPDRSIFGIGGDGLTHWYLADELLARIAADQRPAEELR